MHWVRFLRVLLERGTNFAVGVSLHNNAPSILGGTANELPEEALSSLKIPYAKLF
jgi:hypothetical protein